MIEFRRFGSTTLLQPVSLDSATSIPLSAPLLRSPRPYVVRVSHLTWSYFFFRYVSSLLRRLHAGRYHDIHMCSVSSRR
ncbi:hypothetical protein HETIRDRAFT_413885 [Heterobasidion irregulare TC 32-1]|uniref:Uncharacterized protein n=1 Tax=Heterobasidion irregulare (strain TC 32-1) TaxID=747525 RepID=W4KS06_HETIT|nr:uncharacterized protein HETIRDRAFT_413885 [Heterobasidion irregulare TC 32-1]ETW87841.1 hypothetical protein HETIRDRAFT_413885 [Heterobasidion irregulare TC 32-1]